MSKQPAYKVPRVHPGKWVKEVSEARSSENMRENTSAHAETRRAGKFSNFSYRLLQVELQR